MYRNQRGRKAEKPFPSYIFTHSVSESVEEEDLRIDSEVLIARALSRRALDPIAIAGWLAQISDFNRLNQYASSPGRWIYCYTELAYYSRAVAETLASIHCAYSRMDGQAEWI